MKIILSELQYNNLIGYHKSFQPDDDDKITNKSNYVITLSGEIVGKFGVGIIGKVPTDPLNYFKVKNGEVYPNSIFLTGGFIIFNKQQGIGRNAIKEIFKRNPSIQNIFLYANDWTRGVPFWLKIGGEILLGTDGELVYIQVNKDNLK